MTSAIFAEDALLPDGWAKNVLLQWDDEGELLHVSAGEAPQAYASHAAGPVLPGLPNLHSHAFQRAFAGLTEHRSGKDDSFWSWRALMYRFAQRLGPHEMEAIATWLYAEMLEAGYTSVCEFQYVHHDVDGHAYADDASLSRALLAAARRTGIGITLLPVLYQSSGFGSMPPHEGQRRFVRSTESMLSLIQTLAPEFSTRQMRLGVAPHSLRAVPPEALRDVVAGLAAMDATAPIHIHIAEQTKEVDDCLAWSGRRPVAWLLDHAPVDARWCLVHATHMDDSEYEGAARSGAVVGLCPTTEANLGDGLFDFDRWRGHNGAWGLGSDSNVCVNAAEELMLLEYGQRLLTRRRNVGAMQAEPHVATALMQQAVRGGAQAAGRRIGGLAPGQQADFVVLDATHFSLQGLPGPDMLSTHIFGSHRTSTIDAVWVAGRPRVTRGRHALREQAAAEFVVVRSQMLRG